MKKKVLVVVGPTSSGKSALAVELAKKFNGEVISADSRQIYKGLDIGTGKITKREMRGIRHHLLDIASPNKVFTASDFVRRARKEIDIMIYHNKLPIIAGGTGFYIDALLGRISLPEVPTDSKLRTKLEKMSAPQLFTLLQKRDPRRARTIDRHNKVRLVRALEIVAALGSVPKNIKSPALYDALWIGISPSSKELEHKIAIRLFARIRLGMIAEAKRLHAAGLSYERMEQLGLEYRSLARLLQKKISRKEFEAELLTAIRKYAKRQVTYWKRNKDIRWFKPSQKATAIAAVSAWLRS